MAFKFVAFLALLATSSAGVLPAQQVYHSDASYSSGSYAVAPAYKASIPVTYAHAPVAVAHAHPVLAKHDDEYDAHPQYKFGYDVQDSLTGDSKSQVEERDGDAVRGEYSLIDADGFKRTVQYTSDPVNGFNAVVNREPLVKAVKTIAAPAHYGAPVAVKAAPLAYAAPAALVKEYPIHTYHH